MSESELEQFFAQESAEDDEQAQLSRRQFLRGGLAGGAVGLAVAAGVGAAVWKMDDARLLAAQEAAEAEIARLRGLVDLYERLEKVGLDAILQTGMAAVALPLEAVELGARALKSGLELVEKALRSLEEALPSAQESLLWLEGRVSALAEGIEKLETAIGRALDRAAGTPIGQAVSDFANLILDNLPFGLGDKIRAVLDGLVGLVTGVDELIEGINTHLLEPLRQKWFSTEKGQGVNGALVDPLVEHVLDPLEAHLADLAVLTDAWQQKLVAPARQALEERSRVREEIARYRQEHGLG